MALSPGRMVGGAGEGGGASEVQGCVYAKSFPFTQFHFSFEEFFDRAGEGEV